MSTLTDLVAEHTALGEADLDHLHRLAADWQILSDLSFADLLLWVPTREGAFLCGAHTRPTTAPTAHPGDQVGRVVSCADMPWLAVARDERRIWREGDPVWRGDLPIRHEAIPVVREGAVIAVVGRDTDLAAPRMPSQLELSYLESAADLCQMVTNGTFPAAVPLGDAASAPRVGDGLLRLDAHGRVSYASPNALSAFRRLGVSGDVQGLQLEPALRLLCDDALEGGEAAQMIADALAGRSPQRREVVGRGASVLLRAVPLLPDFVPIGTLVLVCDVTELRHRDRQLIGKDATIREIHHRVKNNLQTVAALLRLQARRVDEGPARDALNESVRRVTSIAFVHETLSGSVDEQVEFDGIVDRIASMVAEVAAPEATVRVRRTGQFGVLGADVATPLVLVLTELAQNAVEHAFVPGVAGDVVIEAVREPGMLVVTVSDDGVGLPPDFSMDSPSRLGLQIVRTLVESELRGRIALRPRPGAGTQATMEIPLEGTDRRRPSTTDRPADQ